jgi:hypothetical protein
MAAPMANGQPEETTTRHQFISIPSGPKRGRTCQCLQPGSPMSSPETRTHLCFSGSSSISSIRRRFSSSRCVRSDSARRDSRTRTSSSSRSSSSSSRASMRGPPRDGEATPNSNPLRGQVEVNNPASSDSSLAI